MKQMDNKKQTELTQKEITRKEALLKGGKYAAFTAATMMMLLGPSKEAAAQSNPQSPPTRWDR
jgi:hypothetical protein